jgi:hypothetical protein
MRKAEKGSDVAADDWADSGADAIKLRLELSEGRAVITEYYPSGPVTGFDEPYSIFKDLIKLESADNSFTARWELDRNRLRFSDVSGPPGDQYIWGRTWIKTE